MQSVSTMPKDLRMMELSGRGRRRNQNVSISIPDPFSFSFSADGKRLASAAEDGTLRIWDTETAQQVLLLTPPGGRVNTLVFPRMAPRSSLGVKVAQSEAGTLGAIN
jgi:WD40 repeat protein